MTTNSKGVKTATGHITTSRKTSSQTGTFLGLFVLIFFTTTGIAAALDVLPESQTAAVVYTDTTSLAVGPIEAIAEPELPTKIEIPTIDLSVSISNPESTSIEVLDRELLKGAVRYPTSSKLGEPGNLIVFGHSSYLPIVNNKAFKAFDGIQDLNKGDRITVTGENHEYVYAVETVVKANAKDDSIPLIVEGSKLTLATCNSFGDESDRFVVTATLIETNRL